MWGAQVSEEELRAQLRREQSFGRQCLDVSPNIMVALDLEGRVTAVNPAACRLLGAAESELLGAVWFKRCLPQPAGMSVAWPAFQSFIRDAAITRAEPEVAPWMGERVVTGDSRPCELRWRVGMLSCDGDLNGLIACGTDLTERHLLEENLAQERFLLQSLMSHVPDHVYFKDRESRIIRLSQSMATKLGLKDAAEAIGKTDFDFFSDEHARQAFEDEREVMRSERPLTLEERETWLDQSDTWVSTTKVPLRDEDGAVVGTFGISRDITDRRRIESEVKEQIVELTILNRRLNDAQNQLLQSEKMASVGQLAAGVAHEINNPIGYISSNLSSLKGQVGALLYVLNVYEQSEPLLRAHADALMRIEQAKAAADFEFLHEDVGNLIDESLDGVNRVKKIVDNLKDFSRVDTAEWQFANLEQGIESTLNIVWNEIKYKAEVVREFAGLPEVECIASQLNQVFMNLLINAAQAIEGRGQIILRTGFDTENVWVEVEDSGKGIKPEHLKKIFEPFFTTKPVGKGTGLGLSLAYGIVELHRGKLDVQSAPGAGAKFRVTIPRKRAVENRSE